MDKINTTAEALTYLYNISLNTSDFRFRGQAKSSWPLTPKIYRYNSFQRYQAIIHERDLMKFRPLNPNPPLTHTTFEIEWLMVCQHYDVPTRLLDWTSDILIALYFACADKTQIDEDGAIFICNKENYKQFSIYHDQIIKEQGLVFVNTNITNPRMRFQSGSFMLWGAAPLNNKSKESYDLWSYHEENNESDSLQKLIIPSKQKEKILNELNFIYALTEETVLLMNGYLEKTFLPNFNSLEDQLRLMTIYQTDSARLNEKEKRQARTYFKMDCENWLSNCISLSVY